MQNRSLAGDYIKRASHRLAAVDVLYDRESWADVVRESQEIVELALKALLRTALIEVPRIHDVSQILLDQKERFNPTIQKHLERFGEISRSLRRDRELAFYGSEDLTPSDFYTIKDATEAREQARWVVETIHKESIIT